MKKVLLIVGSWRTHSFNQQLAEKAAELLEGKAQVRFLHYADVPFLNQDFEYPAPEPVARVRQAAQEADGIWIFTPEYNYQIPGVLKNLLDWLSRPLVPNDWERGSAVKGKVVTVSGAAGASAAVGVRKQLRMLLEAMRMNPIGGAGTGVALDAEAFQSGKLHLSEESEALLRKQAEELLKAIG